MGVWLPMILYGFVSPGLCYYFYCKFFSLAPRYVQGLLLASLFLVLSYLMEYFLIPPVCSVFFFITFMALWGRCLSNLGTPASLAVSTLVSSVYFVSAGMAQAVNFQIVSGLKEQDFYRLRYLDTFGGLLTLALMVLAFWTIYRLFHKTIGALIPSTSILMGIPLLFIALVEKTVSVLIYGNTVVLDTKTGLVFPTVNNGAILVLQLFAYGALFATLAAFQKLNHTIKNQQTIKLLEQQTHELDIYVKESQARYRQTDAFRHDIKNHLLVLSALLEDGKAKEAMVYLKKLEQIPQSLSCPVHTGNMVADALLGSKCSMARQNQISMDWNITIPSKSGIKDTDWCILLSNAIDNAINANLLLEPEGRSIFLTGKQKGNLYFLQITNPCPETLPTPSYGTGLSNMDTVAASYGGTLEIERVGGQFRLNILLVISQHETAIP